jgi:6-phosphogluconolactonase (cycloisomerase 2 family)
MSHQAASPAGHLYLQTNEIRNAIVHFVLSKDGSLLEAERLETGGNGSGVFKPVSGQESAPNAFEGAGSIILTPDRRFLLATNGGNNSVSSFRLDEDGRLTLMDVQPTGNPVMGKSGTAKSLAFQEGTGTIFVLHSFGPDHIRLMTLGHDGRLTPRPEAYTVNTPEKTDRVASQAVLSPDGRFLLVGILFDERPSVDGDGTVKLVVANETDSDGVAVFPVSAHGGLDAPMLQDGGGAGPFYTAFLHGRPNTFIKGLAVGDGLVIGRIDDIGIVSNDGIVPIDTSAGKPSELCWLAISPDDRWVFATNFGYSNISSYRIDGDKLLIARDPACPPIPGDGTFRAVNGNISSGPSDCWMTPDGRFLYQIYGNASVLMGYAIDADGGLKEIARADIPYNSPQGLAGF